MSNHNDPGATGLSRRQVIRGLAGAGVTGVLAGCGTGDGDTTTTTTTTTTTEGGGDGGDDEEETTTTTTTAVERSDQTFRWAWSRGDLTAKELNPFAPTTSGETAWHIFAMVGQPALSTDEWITIDTLGRDEGWEFDDANNEFRIEIKEDVHWHQGGEIIDDFVGEDFVMEDELNRLLVRADPDDSVSENPAIVGYDHDGKTAIYQLNPDGYNKALLPRPFHRSWRGIYREFWRDVYEGLKDASTEDEMADLRTQMIERKVQLPDDPPLNGPFMLESVSSQGAEFTRNPEHWSVEHVDWDNYRMVSLGGGGNADYQAALQDRVDMNVGIPDTVDDAPDQIVQVQGAPGRAEGRGLCINYGGDADPWFGFEGGPGEEDAPGKRQALARQALGYQMDFRSIAINAWGKQGENAALFEKPFPGDPAKVKEQFPELYESVPSFLEQQPEKAEQALRESGLSKEGGTWVKPGGDPLVLEIESFSWSRDDMATIVEDFQEIGLQAEHVTQEQGVLFSRLGGGDFALAQGWNFDLDGPVSAQATYAESGWPNCNQPDFYEVPPIGEWDADPSRRVDVRELASAVETSSPENHREELRELVWLGAYHQPQIQYARAPNTSGFQNRRFRFPEYPEVGDDNLAVATADNAAPIWLADQAWRLIRRGLERPNNIVAREG